MPPKRQKQQQAPQQPAAKRKRTPSAKRRDAALTRADDPTPSVLPAATPDAALATAGDPTTFPVATIVNEVCRQVEKNLAATIQAQIAMYFGGPAVTPPSPGTAASGIPAHVADNITDRQVPSPGARRFPSSSQHPTVTPLTSLTSHAQALLQAALAPSTQSAYARSWECLRTFCTSLGLLCSVPLEVSVLMLFIAHLHQKGLKPSTISAHVAAISYVHKLQSLPDPAHYFSVQKMLLACHKQGDTFDSRLPIDKQLLGTLIGALEHTIPSPKVRILFQAMFALAFHAFLRIGEITVRATSDKDHEHLLKVNQVNLTPQALTVNFISYKHSKGQPFTLSVHPNPLASECPVQIMHKYLASRGSGSGPLFQLAPSVPVTRTFFNAQLRLALAFCKLPTDRFKAHSFRIGAATTAASMGLSDSQIRQLGRWQSDAFKKYIRCSQRLSSL